MSDDLPQGYIQRDGRVYNARNEWVEWVGNKWMKVLDGSRVGWWRHHEHYDRDGYCDNPARGY